MDLKINSLYYKVLMQGSESFIILEQIIKREAINTNGLVKLVHTARITLI